jgi:tRNA pseudouridine65 synthase
VILHRDDRAVVVDKPAGVATHRGWADDEDALLQRVRDAIGARVYPVHRLDRGASGVVLFALDSAAAAAFSRAWPEAEKRYFAITRGHPPAHAIIDHPIPKVEGGERVPAVTEIWLRETFGRYALVECAPRTGRLHQIRRHLKHLSCPLIGDANYGKSEHNRIFRERFGLSRLALHAASLRVLHPDGHRLEVEAPLAEDLGAAIERARSAFE